MAWSDAARKAALEARRLHASRNVTVTKGMSGYLIRYAGYPLRSIDTKKFANELSNSKAFRNETAVMLKRARKSMGVPTFLKTYGFKRGK